MRRAPSLDVERHSFRRGLKKRVADALASVTCPLQPGFTLGTPAKPLPALVDDALLEEQLELSWLQLFAFVYSV